MHRRGLIVVALVLLGAAVTASLVAGFRRATAPPVAPPTVTFAADIAPLVYRRCAACHRPDGVAPFPLLTYADVQARAAQIAAVTASRYMPPWLPEPGHGRFQGERRLTDAELALIGRWVAAGAPQGDPTAAPRPPAFPSGWPLGPPDRVVTLPEPYPVPAAGAEIFRNFVLPAPVSGTRYVRAVDIQPGNPRVVHHATLLVDTSGNARRLDAQDPEPGYAGMEGGTAPNGLFIGWSPGRQPRALEAGLAWRLDPGADLVLQLHLVPPLGPRARTGRGLAGLEEVRPQIGLYFADAAPRHEAVTVHLGSSVIDIPAGAPVHVVTDELEVPVEVDVLAIYPHAHYLGREMTVTAILPGGDTRPLLWIRRWNFDWQDEYRYAEPVTLPAGTRVKMAFTYDNSSDNPRNPSRPPRRVRWGSRSVDEMADVWLTAIPRRTEDAAPLRERLYRHDLARLAAGYAARLAVEPDDFEARSRLGHILLWEGQAAAALPHLERALRAQPGDGGVRHNLGVAAARLGRHAEALGHFEAALRINPGYPATHDGLATTLVLLGRLEEAAEHYARALALRPEDPDVHANAGVVLARLGRLEDAERHYREALRLRPGDVDVRVNLGALRLRQGRTDDAAAVLAAALQAQPAHAGARRLLAAALTRLGRREEALPHLQRAVELRPDDADARVELAAGLAAVGRTGEAIVELEAILQLRPDHAAARRGLERLREHARRGS